MSYPSINTILGSDAHTAALTALYNRGAWPSLARYWYAHQHKPAMRAAIRILFFDREDDPTLDSEERATRAALATGLNVFLTAPSTLGMFPIGYFGHEDREARLTIDFLNLLGKINLCESAVAEPVQRRTPLMSAGLNAAMEALHIVRELNDFPCQGFLQSLIATTFTQLRQFGSAREYFLNAIDTRRQLLKTNADVYSSDLALTLMNYGNLLRDAGELEPSRDAIVEAVALYRHAYSVDAKLYCPDLARCLGNLSLATRLLGSTTAAVAQAEEAITLMRVAVSLNSQHRPELANLLLSRADIGERSPKDERTEEYIEEGSALLRSLISEGNKGAGESCDGTPFDVERLSTLAALFQSDSDTGGDSTARTVGPPSLERVRVLARKQPVVYRPILAVLLTQQAIAEMQDRQLDKAEQQLIEAASLFDEDSEARPFSFLTQKIQCWMGLGIILNERSDPRRMDSLRKAAAAFRRARTLVEELRASFLADTHRDRAHQDTHQIYEWLFHCDISLWMASGDQEAIREAVEVAEASRARRLNDQIAAERLAPRDLPENLRGEFLRIRHALYDAERSLYTQEDVQPDSVLSKDGHQGISGTPQRISDLQSEILTLRKEYRAIVYRIRRDHNPMFEPDRAVRPILFDEIQSLIPEDKPTAIVQFVVGNERSTALITTKEDVIAVQLPDINNARVTGFTKIWRDAYQRRPNNIARHLRDLRARRKGPADAQYLRRLRSLVAEAEQSQPSADEAPLSECDSAEHEEACIRRIERAIDEGLPAFAERSWTVVIQHLLQPVSEGAVHPIQGPLHDRGIKRLIISANRGLHAFPLHACRLDRWEYVYGAHPIGIRNFEQRTHTAPEDLGRYFCDEFEIVYTPSLSILFRLALSGPRERDRLALFADPTYNLAFSEVEAVAVQAQYLNNVVHIGDAATKPIFLAESQSAPILQFCGHATFDSADPLSASLLFGNGGSNDRVLTLREIFSKLRMEQTSLAVLSGCETGMLIPDDVDEYVSLSSGFLYAGAPCVVSSLWEVDDFVSALLMCRFHYELNRGSGIGTALWNSQRWLREDIASGEDLEREVLPWLFERVDDPDLQRICKKAARLHAERSPTEPPFRSPAYWAAFSVTGWGFDSAPLGSADLLKSLTEKDLASDSGMVGPTFADEARASTDSQSRQQVAATLEDRLADLGSQAQTAVSSYVSERLAKRERRKRLGWLRSWAESRDTCKEMLSLFYAGQGSAVEGDVKSAFEAGIRKVEEGHISAAIPDFEEALRRCDGRWTEMVIVNQWALGMAYLAQGHSKESLRLYESAMSNVTPGLRTKIMKGLVQAVQERSLDCLDQIAEHLEGDSEITTFIEWQEEIDKILSAVGPRTSTQLDALLSRRESLRNPGLDVLVQLAKCRVAASAGARSELFARLTHAECVCERIDNTNREPWYELVRAVKTGYKWQVLAAIKPSDSDQAGLQLIVEDEFETALVCFLDAATSARAGGNAERLTESLIGITWCLVETGRRKDSRTYIAEARQLVRESGKEQWRDVVERLSKRAESEADIPSACTLRRRAQSELISGWPEDATHSLAAALKAAEVEHNLREESRIRFDLVGALIEAGKPLEANDAIDQGVTLSRTLKDNGLRRALLAKRQSIADLVSEIRQIEQSLAAELRTAGNEDKARIYASRASAASDPRVAEHFANQALMFSATDGTARFIGEALLVKAMTAAAVGRFENAKRLALRVQGLVDDVKILDGARSVLEYASLKSEPIRSEDSGQVGTR